MKILIFYYRRKPLPYIGRGNLGWKSNFKFPDWHMRVIASFISRLCSLVKQSLEFIRSFFHKFENILYNIVRCIDLFFRICSFYEKELQFPYSTEKDMNHCEVLPHILSTLYICTNWFEVQSDSHLYLSSLYRSYHISCENRWYNTKFSSYNLSLLACLWRSFHFWPFLVYLFSLRGLYTKYIKYIITHFSFYVYLFLCFL